MVKALYSDQKNEIMDPSDKSELPLKGVWHRGVPGLEQGHAGEIQLIWERLIVSWMLEERVFWVSLIRLPLQPGPRRGRKWMNCSCCWKLMYLIKFRNIKEKNQW